MFICKKHWSYGAGKPIIKRMFISDKKIRRHNRKYHDPGKMFMKQLIK